MNPLDSKQQLIIIVILGVFIFTAGYKVSHWQGGSNIHSLQDEDIVQKSNHQTGRDILVHVSGAVENPGVYRLSSEMRVLDALEKATPAARADIQSLNLAAPLKDGQKIVVPLKQDSPPDRGVVTSPQKVVKSGAPEKININRASAKELESLPGIGPALSERTVNYRETKGLFTSEEDIKSVPGIGDKLYDQIKEYISVY